jgi:putative ABC transport system permease protein
VKPSHVFRLAWLEIVRFKSVSLFLVLNLALGLVGFFLLQIFQQSLSAQSAARAQFVLGGDISIEARRLFSEAERKEWESQFQFKKSTQFYRLFSMLRSATDTQLVNVGVFDDAYPLYGEFKFSGPGFSSDTPRVWVDPEVQDVLHLKDGEKVQIGEAEFLFSGVIVEDPSRLFRGMGFAPRVLIHRNFLQQAQLIKPGSTLNEHWMYSLEPGSDLVSAREKIERIVKDPIIQIETTKDSAKESNRVLQYFTDYLGLVALVALGLCFLCGSYLLQWTFLSKKKSIAIYKTMGLSDNAIVSIYLIQNFIISFLACALGYAVVQSLQPLMQQILLHKFNLPLELVFDAKASLITAVIAVLGPMLMVVPQIIQIIELRPLMLFQNIEGVRRGVAYYIWLGFSVFLFWALSVWQSSSFQIASIFTGALVGMVVLFHFINRLILFLLEKSSHRLAWLTKYSVRGLTRKRASAGLVFTTMSLSTLVLSLLPHVKTSIINEIKPQNTSQMPSLFMFDIQPEQVAGVQALAKKYFNQELTFSPLVRSRILKINGQNYERAVQTSDIQTREAETEARFRNRGLNLTYRGYLQESETLIDGAFEGRTPEGALPKISLEERYAGRVGVKMGDIMTFDVQGVELRAQVGSIRQVRWTSFQPNFFIIFPDGVLNEAPQIFLTSVAGQNNAVVKQFQREVAGEFKNVSIVDVTRTVENSLKYIEQMSLGLQFMAWLAVLVGLFVFVVLLNTQIKERLQEMNLLQILGSTSAQVLKVILVQFVILIVTSITFGVALGLGMAWLLISFFFKVQTVYDIQYLFLLAAVLLPVCGLALYFGLRPLKKLNPMDLIRQS